MDFDSIRSVINRYNPQTDVEKAAYIKINEAKKKALETKDGAMFRNALFAGYLGNDQDAWALLHKIFGPEAFDELTQLRFGEKFNWTPKQVASIMGVKDPIDLVKTSEAFNIPSWKIGRGESPEEIKKSLASQYKYLDPDKLYNWLEAYQNQYENQKKYTGGFKNATRSIFAPRSHEALLLHGKTEPKDIVGDVAENILQTTAFIPARGVALGARALKLTHPLARAGEAALSSAVVPTIMNTSDAIAYNVKENPYRYEFSPSKVAKETAINAATVPAISSRISSAGRAAGLSGTSKRNIMESISGDPYIDAQHAIAELSTQAPVLSGKSPTQLKIESDIVKAVEKNQGKAKKLGKEQRKKWEGWVSNKAPEDVVDNITKDIESIEKLPEPYKTQALNEYYANREVVYPTEFLSEKDRMKYGLSEDGRLSIVGSRSGLSSRHNIPTTISPNRSAKALKQEEKARHTDKVYNRESEFDKAVALAQQDPYVRANVNMNNPLLISKLAFSNLTGNKLGKEEYATRLGFEKDKEDEVKELLADSSLKKMWDMGFEPNNKNDDSDPFVVAWKIYKGKEQ